MDVREAFEMTTSVRRGKSVYSGRGSWIAVVVLGLALLPMGLPSGGALQASGKTLTVVLDAEANRADEAEAIAADLRVIGVQADVRIWEWSALKDSALKGERQMYLTDWGSAYFDPFDLAVPKLRTGDRGNYSHYSNPAFDLAMDTALSAVDPEVRRKAYRDAQAIIREDAPWIFGYYLSEIEAARADVKGWQPAMDSRINLHDVGLARGDTIVVAMKTDKVVTLDPAMHRERDTETVIRNMFDGLVTRTWDGKVVPEIAESWATPQDNVYVFKIRKGIKFHNGEELDADDVIFTFERTLKSGTIGGRSSPRAGLLGPIEKVEKLDKYTVRFSLSNPFPVFLQALVQTQVVPKDYIETVGDEEFARNPVGCGPFKFVGGRLDDQIVMERFDAYYGGSPDLPPVGLAQVKRVIFRMMPDPTVRIAALKAGEVQIAQQVPPDLVASLERDKNVQVKAVEGTRVYCVELNCSAPPFNDVRVRRAMNYAVNWDRILKTIYGGTGKRLATAFLPSGFGFDPDLRPYPYDPEKAKALLREAGYSVK
ncbi:MAG: ABC transporter substrate-binding protein [Firmicutes bacterium]|jgi:peptide/nickel transport system substrate-binding protein|nr:ABC transporter substrate-binding protein [Bacillota bacterium]MDH7494422.1 ABC transporter substrate-binding protein [Bacillota bacterium]